MLTNYKRFIQISDKTICSIIHHYRRFIYTSSKSICKLINHQTSQINIRQVYFLNNLSLNQHLQFIFRLIHAKGERSSCWFIDNTQHIETSYLTCILRRLKNKFCAGIIIMRNLIKHFKTAAGYFKSKFN